MIEMPETPMLDALLAEVQSLRDAATDAERKMLENATTYERLRPHWAKGYTSDSMAAQASTSALSELWTILEVDNQTAAVVRLRQLIARDNGGRLK